jgi:hypothetical protein
MNTESTSMAPSLLAQEADATAYAITAQAKAESLTGVAELFRDANQDHVAEHIRGLVAVTMAHLSIKAAVTTRDNAKQWQDWALRMGFSEGFRRWSERDPAGGSASNRSRRHRLLVG